MRILADFYQDQNIRVGKINCWEEWRMWCWRQSIAAIASTDSITMAIVRCRTLPRIANLDLPSYPIVCLNLARPVVALLVDH
jgi:hypothetical protein